MPVLCAHVRRLLAVLISCLYTMSVGADVISHQISVTLEPDRRTIDVVDRVSLPESLVSADDSIEFSLNAAFEPAIDGAAHPALSNVGSADSQGLLPYRLELDGVRQFTLRYRGALGDHENYSLGYIGPEGVYLGRAAGWYPQFADALHRFSMQITLPGKWTAVSQGEGGGSQSSSGLHRVSWTENQPQDQIYLVAGPLQKFVGESPIAQVYLRSSNETIAARYLAATEQYLELYQQLLGPYPYAKFALVENFWETGYGMPSFTLLGPRVLRLPFIIHTSYPHEIVHNWWGNGVYVDYRHGNWSEGLTAYLADHLMRELEGQGASYRRDALQKYRNYVERSEDFALSEFIGKHGEASEAVGYNKALMFFHMIRQRLGDKLFLRGLAHFYRQHRFQRAGYPDLQNAFEYVSGEDLGAMFHQWVERTGAPILALQEVKVSQNSEGFRGSGVLQQIQDGAVYQLVVPVALQRQTLSFNLI